MTLRPILLLVMRAGWPELIGLSECKVGARWN